MEFTFISMACDGVFVCVFFYISTLVLIFIFNQLEVFMCSLLSFLAINIFGCVAIEMASSVVLSLSLTHFYGSHFNDTFAVTIAADALFSAYVIPRKTTNCHHIYIVVYK